VSEEACSCAKLQVPVRRRSGGVAIFSEPGAQVAPSGRSGSDPEQHSLGHSWAIALSAQNRGCDGLVDARWDTTEAPPRQAKAMKIDARRRLESPGSLRESRSARADGGPNSRANRRLIECSMCDPCRRADSDTNSRVQRCCPSMRSVLRVDRLRPRFPSDFRPFPYRGAPPPAAAARRRNRKQRGPS
jgi:hypothetical protein